MIANNLKIENLNSGAVFWKKDGLKYHISIKKTDLINILRRVDNEKQKIISLNGVFKPSYESIKLLKNMNVEYITFGACDNLSENGMCLGHSP